MSNHVTEWLNAYFDGELTGNRLHQVEDHLAECEACQAELESLQGFSELVAGSSRRRNFLHLNGLLHR